MNIGEYLLAADSIPDLANRLVRCRIAEEIMFTEEITDWDFFERFLRQEV